VLEAAIKGADALPPVAEGSDLDFVIKVLRGQRPRAACSHKLLSQVSLWMAEVDPVWAWSFVREHFPEKQWRMLCGDIVLAAERRAQRLVPPPTEVVQPAALELIAADRAAFLAQRGKLDSTDPIFERISDGSLETPPLLVALSALDPRKAFDLAVTAVGRVSWSTMGEAMPIIAARARDLGAAQEIVRIVQPEVRSVTDAPWIMIAARLGLMEPAAVRAELERLVARVPDDFPEEELSVGWGVLETAIDTGHADLIANALVEWGMPPPSLVAQCLAHDASASARALLASDLPERLAVAPVESWQVRDDSGWWLAAIRHRRCVEALRSGLELAAAGLGAELLCRHMRRAWGFRCRAHGTELADADPGATT
jgi:hypothetical protein